ncbi:MAG: hypothetical protein ACLT8E_04920 [Akkermansia sp.]
MGCALSPEDKAKLQNNLASIQSGRPLQIHRSWADVCLKQNRTTEARRVLAKIGGAPAEEPEKPASRRRRRIEALFSRLTRAPPREVPQATDGGRMPLADVPQAFDQLIRHSRISAGIALPGRSWLSRARWRKGGVLVQFRFLRPRITGYSRFPDGEHF